VALTYLQDEGEIHTYHIHTDGFMSVEWFTEYDKTKIEIVQSVGWEIEELIQGELSNNINVANLSKDENGVYTANQGVAPYVAEDTRGAGGFNTDHLKQNDKDCAMWKSINKGLYEHGHDLRNKKRLERGEKIKLW
jgi:hypothetical protein